MKILHILSSNKYSGAENVVCQIISNFKQHHQDCELFYCSPSGPIQEVLQRKNISFIGTKKNSKKQLQKILDQLKPDIIHAHDFRSSVLSSMLRFNGRIFFHFHNNLPWMKRVSIKSLLVFWSCKKASIIYTVSKSVIDECFFSKKMYSKFKCIGNPFDAYPIIEMSREATVVNKYDIGFCGRLSKQKNPFAFIEIIKRIKEKKPDVTAIMIGDGELKESIEKLIEDSDLKENIKIVGFLENPFPTLKQCHVVIMPSLWEGFGLSALESLSLGIPVLASPVGGLPDFVNEKNGSLCNDVEDYLKAYFSLVNNTDVYYQKSLEATKTGLHFSNSTSYCDALYNDYLKYLHE